jgi:hypothetical protein
MPLRGSTGPRIPKQEDGMQKEGHRFALGIDPERFEDAPGLDKENWPNTGPTYPGPTV